MSSMESKVVKDHKDHHHLCLSVSEELLLFGGGVMWPMQIAVHGLISALWWAG